MAARLTRWLPAVLLLLAAAFFVGPARAAVTLRVQPGTSPDPIQVFVTVTDAAGAPVGGLVKNDFLVELDSTPSNPTGPVPFDFTLPPSQSTQKASVVFAMDYSGSVQVAALTEMQDAVIAFVNAMVDGDAAAVVKFNGTAVSVDGPFTVINAAARITLAGQVMAPFAAGNGTNLIDGLNASLNEFITPGVTLPDGPRAMIAITDGLDNSSTTAEGAVVDGARANGIAIFTIGVTGTRNTALLNRLPTLTGGEYIDTADATEIAAAYTRIADKLKNEYLLTVPSTIADCNNHEVGVRVTINGTATDTFSTFARCSAPTSIAVPNVTGMTQAAATSAITGAGLTVGGVTQQSSSTVASGSVISQNPAAGTSVASGSAVSLVVSSGSGGGGGGSSGGGGGGALGLEFLPGLIALLATRRRRWTVRA